jgi:hypothetical protein
MTRTQASIGGAALVSILALSGCTTGAASSTEPTVEGIYRWSTEGEKPGGWQPTETDLVPTQNTFTLTLDDGDWTMTTTVSPQRTDGGSYTVSDDKLVMDWLEPDSASGIILHFTTEQDDDGNLTLEPVDDMDPGDAFVFSSETLTRIGEAGDQ